VDIDDKKKKIDNKESTQRKGSKRRGKKIKEQRYEPTPPPKPPFVPLSE
jgi:hypothetical protein